MVIGLQGDYSPLVREMEGLGYKVVRIEAHEGAGRAEEMRMQIYKAVPESEDLDLRGLEKLFRSRGYKILGIRYTPNQTGTSVGIDAYKSYLESYLERKSEEVYVLSDAELFDQMKNIILDRAEYQVEEEGFLQVSLLGIVYRRVPNQEKVFCERPDARFCLIRRNEGETIECVAGDEKTVQKNWEILRDERLLIRF